MGQYKKENMIKLNKHRDLSKPFWAAITEISGIIHYGKISEINLVRSRYEINTFETKEEVISFVQENGGTYINEKDYV